MAFTATCVVAGLDTPTALAAAAYSARHRLSVADAISYATARAHAADILTCDRHFAPLPGVRYVARPGAPQS